MPNHLVELVADHLHAPAASLSDSTATWQAQFRVLRALHGAGFHRTLILTVQYSEASSQSLEGCQTSLLQPLPSSIYADPYQLEDLERSGSSDVAAAASSIAEGTTYKFQLLGPLDLEL
jgi:hypothetical protein